MKLTLAGFALSVTILSSRKVLPGKNVTSNAEVNDKTAEVTKAEREFIAGVIEMNLTIPRSSSKLADDNPSNVRGINFETGINFDPPRDLPILASIPTRDPEFRNPIIDGLTMDDSELTLDGVTGSNISRGSDRGKVWDIDTISSMADRAVFHG